MYLVKAKQWILIDRIEHMIGVMELPTTDIIPLINKAWVISYAEIEPNKKSIE